MQTRRSAGIPIALLVAASLAACAAPKEIPEAHAAPAAARRPEAPAPRRATEEPRYAETGLASWYKPTRRSHSTASGERLDGKAMTAAHPELPFGTVARVTNLGNGHTIKVRINDRGPFREDRVVDLSARAADELGFGDDGLVRVKVEVFDSDQPGPRFDP